MATTKTPKALVLSRKVMECSGDFVTASPFSNDFSRLTNLPIEGVHCAVSAALAVRYANSGILSSRLRAMNKKSHRRLYIYV